MKLDLLAGLRKSGITVSGPLEIDLDEKAHAKQIAEATAAQVSVNLERGCAPSGQPLPPVSQATVERRARRAKREGGNPGGPRGFDTGALAASIVAVPGPDGFIVTQGPGEAPGALGRALGGMDPTPGLDQPLIAAALNAVANKIIGK
jgi:hypothetical protein